MRVAYLDCVGGLSGDMFVGALIDAGWPAERFREAFAWLADEIDELRVEERAHLSFRGQGIVVLPREPEKHSHVHRGFGEVRKLLRSAPLPDPVIGRAIAVFRRLAEAEARAHGKPIEEVHFHEVGAVDALVDVAATCLGLHELGIERLFVSPLPLGSGEITAAHGAIPLPAPATAYLLEGAPVRWTGTDGERCTPTGAALAATLGEWGAPPPMRVESVGSGAGSRPLPGVPNLTRLFVGEARLPDSAPDEGMELTDAPPLWGWPADRDASTPEGGEGGACPGRWRRVICLAAQIDDATPEALAHLAEQLRAAGALDLFMESVIMKKGRMGTALTVVVRPGDDERITTLLLEESPTLGVRWYCQWRRELERRVVEVETAHGRVRGKLAWRGRGWTGKPEYDSCREVALHAGVPFEEVWQAAREALSRLAADTPGEP